MTAAPRLARLIVACSCLLTAVSAACAQGTRPDYERANGLRRLTQKALQSPTLARRQLTVNRGGQQHQVAL